MTLFEFLVPLGALVVAVVGVLSIRRSGKKLEALDRRERLPE